MLTCSFRAQLPVHRHRVVLVSIKKRRIVWQYGQTDAPGRGPGYLHTPDGLDLLTPGAATRVGAVRKLLLAEQRRLAASR